MEYNILLIIFFILSCVDVFIKKTEKNKILLLVIACVVYWIFYGFRGFVAWDWYGDYPAFINDAYQDFEIGYTTFMILGKNIFKDYFNFVAFSTLLDVAILGWFFYKYSPYPILSFCIMFTFNGVIMQLDLLRHMRAFTLFLISLQYVYEKKIIPYELINSIGVLFHRIALLYLPLYFLLTKKIWKFKKIILFLVIIGTCFILFKINLARLFLIKFQDVSFYRIGPKIKSYFSGVHGNIQISNIGNIERMITLFLFYINLDKLREKFKYGELFVNMYLLFILSFTYLYGFKIISDRLSNYTLIISYWILYPMIVKIYPKYFKFCLFIGLMFIMFAKVNLSYVVNARELYKYKNVLFQQEDFHEREQIRAREYKIAVEGMKQFIEEHK